MRRSTDKWKCESGPVEGALLVQPDVAHEQDAKEDEHGDERESAHVLSDPTAIKNGPGKQKHGFHVEDDEEHRNNIETRGITAPSIGFRRNAAFVGEELGVAEARFGTNELEDDQRNHGKRKNQKREDQNRDVGRGHSFASEWMLAQNTGRYSRAMVTAQLLFKEKLTGALRGLHHSLDERDAQLPFFQFHDAVDGAARGSGHRVFQQCWMIAGFKNNAGGALHGLRGQESGNVARKSYFYASLGEGFQNDVGKGWAAGGKSGDRVHILFVDDDGATDRVEHSFGNLEMLWGCVGAAADSSHAAIDGGAGVGHDADDRNLVANALFDVGGGDGSGDGNDERVFAKLRLDLLEDVANNLRFDAEKNDVRIFYGLAIVGGNGNAEFLGENGGFLFVANGGGDALRHEQALFEVGAKKDSAEFAGAENGETFVGKFVWHGGTIVMEEWRSVKRSSFKFTVICVCRGKKGVTGEWLVSREKKGLRGKWPVTSAPPPPGVFCGCMSKERGCWRENVDACESEGVRGDLRGARRTMGKRRRRNEPECSRPMIAANLSTVESYLIGIVFTCCGREVIMDVVWSPQKTRIRSADEEPSLCQKQNRKGRPPGVILGL
jgi:hypothetical protein